MIEEGQEIYIFYQNALETESLMEYCLRVLTE